jgi:hypothetical protein
MNTTDTHISVWYDSTGGDDPAWVVERCDEDGSETIKLFATEHEAIVFAKEYSERVGLPIW